MAKIGRNVKCPCGSDRKYKHCCIGQEASMKQLSSSSQEQSQTITLNELVQSVQEQAKQFEVGTKEVGVFFFFTTATGDGWVLETTQCDCVQIASKGEPILVSIDEDGETIAINWSHSYALKKNVIELKSYLDGATLFLDDAPRKDIQRAMKRIRKKLNKSQLQQLHI